MMGTHQLHLAISYRYQTALSVGIRRLPAHPASALTSLFILEKYKLCDHINHDTGSYDTLYQVDNSSNDVVIYWTMIGTHVVPDRQQYDGHTPITSCKTQIDMIPGVSISYQTALSTSIRRLPTPSVRADCSSH